MISEFENTYSHKRGTIMLIARFFQTLLAISVALSSAVASASHIEGTIYGDRSRNPDGSRRDNRGTDMSDIFRRDDNSARRRAHDEANDRIGIYKDIANNPGDPALKKQVATLAEGVKQLQSLVEKRNKVREEIIGSDHQAVRQELVDLATDSLRVSRDYYRNDEFEEGQIAATIADVALDLATSFTPGVSWGRDIYEAILGKDLISGEELDTFSRSAAVLGAVTAGFGSKVGKGLKVIGRLLKGDNAAGILRYSQEIIDSAQEIHRFGPLDPGALHAMREGVGTVADTFRSSSYFKIVTSKEVKLYRVYNAEDEARRLGYYWSRTKPTGPLQAQLDSALDPSWKNRATAWVEIKVPRGATFYEGAVSPIILKSTPSNIPIGTIYGGGSQVRFVDEIPKSWISTWERF